MQLRIRGGIIHLQKQHRIGELSPYFWTSSYFMKSKKCFSSEKTRKAISGNFIHNLYYYYSKIYSMSIYSNNLS